jgi:alkylation response protein AidB-like acyl-CoA dehydrogenase
MANYFKDNDDLRFYFERGIDWEPLVELTEFEWKARDGFKNTQEAVESYRSIAEMVGDFVSSEIAPYGLEIDRKDVEHRNGEAVFTPRLTQIFDRIKELELHGLTVPRELGGMNCPLILYFMTAEMMARAEVSVMAHHSFHGGMAMAMLAFSIYEGSSEFDKAKGEITKTRWRDYIGEIVRGEAWGCMDITEPNAGSDMARIRTIGEQDAEGNWYVSGQKIFITSGHGKYHFVIARTEKASGDDDAFAGLKGLSMFLVPTYTEDANGRHRIVSLDRIEEKMGHHGSVTGALTFDRAPAQLVGKRGEGFKYMLTLMNNARLGVGFESLGLCEAAYRMASAYAEQRVSMGKPIGRHEMIADYLDEMKTDIQAIRALAMHGAYHEELSHKTGLALRFLADPGSPKAKELEKRQRHHQRQARRVTPLLKYLASEKAVEMARRCIQIHGGSGYIKEVGAEKLLRDALVMPIYEGTSQIQSLMAMKDTLGGAIKNWQQIFSKPADTRWRSLTARDPLERRVAKIQRLSTGAQNHLVILTLGAKLGSLPGKPMNRWPKEVAQNWDPKRDFALAMLHAERLTRLLADEAVVELLLEQARKFPERREVLERYLDRAEPRCRFLYDEITTTGSRVLKQLGRSPAGVTEIREPETPAPPLAATGT